jgi:glyoxylase-like metal-dependent hydrolase (beta-lactamase superfamily II)
MGLRYRIVSIGTLSKNRLWGETQPKRFPHATTTLIQDDAETILVDPSLPAEVLAQRLEERSGLTPDQVQAVFLTTFRPVHRRALGLFDNASWVMHQPEIDAIRQHLAEMTERAARDAGDPELLRLLEDERSILKRIEPARDHVTRRVHLFPAAGVTPGSAGLLLAMPSQTTVIAGDAIITQDHYAAGQVYEQAVMVEEARKSFADIVEVADEIVPGHDNVFRAGTG